MSRRYHIWHLTIRKLPPGPETDGPWFHAPVVAEFSGRDGLDQSVADIHAALSPRVNPSIAHACPKGLNTRPPSPVKYVIVTVKITDDVEFPYSFDNRHMVNSNSARPFPKRQLNIAPASFMIAVDPMSSGTTDKAVRRINKGIRPVIAQGPFFFEPFVVPNIQVVSRSVSKSTEMCPKVLIPHIQND